MQRDFLGMFPHHWGKHEFRIVFLVKVVFLGYSRGFTHFMRVYSWNERKAVTAARRAARRIQKIPSLHVVRFSIEDENSKLVWRESVRHEPR